ncbi:MAG: Replication factor A [Methanonatronarchaeales archaeon]|nr:Replication factor A [Methanonatronarchaeales archaeon]
MKVEEVFEVLHEKEGLTFEEYQALVERKVDSLGGLCDYETAAKLVASDFGVNPEVSYREIGEISGEDEFVSFVGKVVHVGGTHEFSREDGSVGRVANLHVADSSGEVRVAVWNEVADLVKVGELERGEVLRIEGAKVRDGPRGPEVSVSSSTKMERDDSEVDVDESFLPIEKLEPGLGAVHVRGEVLDVSGVRGFERDDGSTGRVSSLRIGDETGKMRVSLWDERAPEAEEFSAGDAVEVRYGYTRERRGGTELHVGSRGSLERSEEEVSYSERFTPLDDVLGEGEYDVRGRVLAVDDVHAFTRRDGSEGRVSNVHLEDDSGRVRCAFWDEKADEVQDAEPGDTMTIRDARGRSGRDGTPELSVGWSGSFELERGGSVYSGPIEGVSGGARVELEGQVVTWSGVLDDGTGCVRTRGKPLPFGRSVRVKGVSEERDGELTVKVDEGETADLKEGDVRSLVERLARL